jgi:hypothetical protein
MVYNKSFRRRKRRSNNEGVKMKKIVMTASLFLMMSSLCLAQISVGITPIFSKQVDNNSFINQEISNSNTLYELEGGVVTRGATLRGYHLFNKDYSTGIAISDDKKSIPAAYSSSFFASRVEIGLPLFFPKFMIEPFFVNSYTKDCFSVVGDKLNYTNSIINNTPGFGVFYSVLLTKGQNTSVKYFITPKDSLLDFRYNWFTSKQSIGIGYTLRTYDNIKISGPFLNFSFSF